MKYEENPWNIDSIYKLQFFICPSCIFKDHSKQEIINHAYEIHPDSIDFLSNIRDNSLTDIICPWNDNEIKEEQIELKPEKLVDDLDSNGEENHDHNDKKDGIDHTMLDECIKLEDRGEYFSLGCDNHHGIVSKFDQISEKFLCLKT